jgi:DNA-binding HxlR family transcriptional regulator
MKRTSLSGQPCAIARTVDVIGEWWTPLILRDLMRGNRRFDGLLESLNISRNILTDRLKTLVNEGVVARHRYQTNPDRYEYILTSKGEDLFPVLLSIMGWGDKWALDNCCTPVKLRHVVCGEIIRPQVVCAHCKQELRLHDARLVTPPEALASSPSGNSSKNGANGKNGTNGKNSTNGKNGKAAHRKSAAVAEMRKPRTRKSR